MVWHGQQCSRNGDMKSLKELTGDLILAYLPGAAYVKEHFTEMEGHKWNLLMTNHVNQKIRYFINTLKAVTEIRVLPFFSTSNT